MLTRSWAITFYLAGLGGVFTPSPSWSPLTAGPLRSGADTIGLLQTSVYNTQKKRERCCGGTEIFQGADICIHILNCSSTMSYDNAFFFFGPLVDSCFCLFIYLLWWCLRTRKLQLWGKAEADRRLPVSSSSLLYDPCCSMMFKCVFSTERCCSVVTVMLTSRWRGILLGSESKHGGGLCQPMHKAGSGSVIERIGPLLGH